MLLCEPLFHTQHLTICCLLSHMSMFHILLSVSRYNNTAHTCRFIGLQPVLAPTSVGYSVAMKTCPPGTSIQGKHQSEHNQVYPMKTQVLTQRSAYQIVTTKTVVTIW